jgi:hypothetical protein
MRISRVFALFFTFTTLFAGTALAQRDNLLCYKAKADKSACAAGGVNAGSVCTDDSQCGGVEGGCAKLPKLPKGIETRLDDVAAGSVGEDKTFNVKKLKQICVPIDDQGRGIADPDRHYLSYAIKQEGKVCDAGTNQHLSCNDNDGCSGGTCVEIAKFDADNGDNINIYVEDQFANIRLNASKVDMLLSPASVCAGGDDAGCLGTPEPAGEEVFKCYRAKATKKLCALGTPNQLQACIDDADCAGGIVGSCVQLDKFVKGQTTYATDDGGDFVLADPNDPNSPERTFDLKSITHLCKGTEITALPGGTPVGPVDSLARLLCYKAKASKAHCQPSAPANALGACSKEVDCGGTNEVTSFCDPQAKFPGTVPGEGFYLNDSYDVVPNSTPAVQGDFHRAGLGKEQMICVPACENPDQAIQFTPNVFRLTALALPPTGHPGQGIDLDNNASTCGPVSHGNCTAPCCSGGIDNWLGILSGVFPDVNDAIATAVSSGDIHLLFEIDDFVNGSQVLNGFQGDLAAVPGCTDFNSGSQVCNYHIDSVGLDTRTCDKQATIEFPVTVSGLPASPVSVGGGGPQASFTLAVPVFGTELALTVRNLVLTSSVVHTGGAVETMTGILGGAIIHQQLKQTITSLPEGLCEGGGNNNEPCTIAGGVADCPHQGAGTSCNTAYLGGIPLEVIAGIVDGIPRDINTDGQLTCEGGTNGGQPCTLPEDCPDETTEAAPAPVACDPMDATSIGLTFSAIDAAITGYDRECDLATCSLE